MNFIEATSVFSGPLARIFVDEMHSADQPQEIILGEGPRSHHQPLAAPRARNCMTMRKMSRTKARANRNDWLRSEYRFDYAKAKPNRFAARTRPGSVAVLLDPDVAQVFKSPQSVNAVLRALMATMPTSRPAARRIATRRSE